MYAIYEYFHSLFQLEKCKWVENDTQKYIYITKLKLKHLPSYNYNQRVNESKTMYDFISKV